MKTTLDPKKLLERLLSGAELPEFSADQVRKARALLSATPRSLSELEALDEPLALAVLEAVVRERDIVLSAAAAGSSHKSIAKAGKKALYQLKSMGLETPTSAPSAAAPPAEHEPAAPEEFFCLLSAVTGTGERALFIVRPQRGGGLETMQILLGDEAGILQFELGEISRSSYRKQVKVLRGGSVPFLEIDLERAKGLLAEAAGLNGRSKTPVPADASEALRHLGVEPLGEPTPLPNVEPEDERLSVNSRALHDEPELLPWLPPEPQLRLLAQRLDEVEASPLELSAAQKSEQLLARVRSTAEEFFTPALKQLYARRLWAMAEVFEKTSRPERAKVARAEARRLFHGVAAPGGFAEGLFEKVLWLSERAQKGQPLPATEPGPAKPTEKTSPGGILLP